MEGQGGEGFRMDGKELRNGVLGHAEYWGYISVFLGYWKIAWKLRSHCGYIGIILAPCPSTISIGPPWSSRQIMLSSCENLQH